MKIVVYSKSFLPSLGGLERNTHTLCRALLEIGHKVQLVTETVASSEDQFSFKVHRTASLSKMRKLIREADLLLVNGGVSLKVLSVALLNGIAYGVIYHNYLAFRRPGNRWYSIQIRKWVAEGATINIFTSKHSRRLARLNHSPCRILLNPVDVDLQPLYQSIPDDISYNEEVMTFLFAGRLIEGKGVFVLLDALEVIDQSSDEALKIRVVFAGTGPAKAQLERRTACLSRVQVELPGQLAAPQLVQMYREAAALIVPSTTHKEGNPLVVAEALYAETPVIASNQPPMVESVGQAGIIVQEGSSEELSRAIESVCSNPDLRKALKEKAGERAEIFSYETYRDELDRILG